MSPFTKRLDYQYDAESKTVTVPAQTTQTVTAQLVLRSMFYNKVSLKELAKLTNTKQGKLFGAMFSKNNQTDTLDNFLKTNEDGSATFYLDKIPLDEPVTPDDVAPVIYCAVLNGKTIQLVFDDLNNLNPSNTPPARQFKGTVNGQTLTISKAQIIRNTKQINLTVLDMILRPADVITISYEVPTKTSSQLQDVQGNLVADFTVDVVNELPPEEPVQDETPPADDGTGDTEPTP